MKLPAIRTAAPERPRLELSGPKLALAFESLVTRSEEHGGVESYVEALKLKSAAFRGVLGDGHGATVDLGALRRLCACVATVRRRAGRLLEPSTFGPLRARVTALVDGIEETSTADARIDEFCAGFPLDREHRWVRDLAAEILHNVDPERYPLMCRWVWDARLNTGVLREIWHADDIDHIRIDVPDRYETFLVLREELSQFLAANGVFRDVVQYVDLLIAQVYAGYLNEQGGTYLRADFATPDEPMLHVRRLLGLDGIGADGHTRLKAFDGTAFVVEDLGLAN
ncbi:MAG TPA: hypothetical protein VF219_08240 [Vicinamibacterales bacterium]